jgi:peptidoglycan/xylan/chitin deacetylase (PgdA/CDA1 family)
VRDEVTACKKRLETITGKQVKSFAYPNGQPEDFNEMVKDEVRTAGYLAAFTGIRGLARPGGDLFEIKRLLVDCRWSYKEFETRASGILEAVGR